MPARKCFTCKAAYPAHKGGPTACPGCGTTLQFSSHAKPDTDYPPEIPAVLPTLTVEQQLEVSAEWSALEAEARKRGQKWSLADLIGEGVRRAS